MQSPRKYFITDIQEDISSRRLTFKTHSSIDLYWQFTSSGVPLNLTGCTGVFFVYSDDNQSVSAVGSILDITDGTVKVSLTPSKLAIVGEFDWDLYLMDSNGLENVSAYGPLIMIGDVDELNESSSSSSEFQSTQI